jgi:hypothetical protein
MMLVTKAVIDQGDSVLAPLRHYMLLIGTIIDFKMTETGFTE